MQLAIDRKNDKAAKEAKEIIDKAKAMLLDKKPVRDGDWNAKEIEELNNHLFMTSKPVVYLVNISKEEYITKKNKWLPKILQWINANGGGNMVPYSAEFEKEVL